MNHEKSQEWYWVVMMTFEFEITRGNRVPLILKNASEWCQGDHWRNDPWRRVQESVQYHLRIHYYEEDNAEIVWPLVWKITWGYMTKKKSTSTSSSSDSCVSRSSKHTLCLCCLKPWSCMTIEEKSLNTSKITGVHPTVTGSTTYKYYYYDINCDWKTRHRVSGMPLNGRPK